MSIIKKKKNLKSLSGEKQEEIDDFQQVKY